MGNKAYYALVAVWSLSDLNQWKWIAVGSDNVLRRLLRTSTRIAITCLFCLTLSTLKTLASVINGDLDASKYRTNQVA